MTSRRTHVDGWVRLINRCSSEFLHPFRPTPFLPFFRHSLISLPTTILFPIIEGYSQSSSHSRVHGQIPPSSPFQSHLFRRSSLRKENKCPNRSTRFGSLRPNTFSTSSQTRSVALVVIDLELTSQTQPHHASEASSHGPNGPSLQSPPDHTTPPPKTSPFFTKSPPELCHPTFTLDITLKV